MDDQRGFTTIQYVVVTGFTLMLFVLLANVLIDMYAHAAVRDALDEGVHSAVAADGSGAACEARAREVVQSIASGAAVHVDALTCVVIGTRVIARARVALASWLFLPDWHVELVASAERE